MLGSCNLLPNYPFSSICHYLCFHSLLFQRLQVWRNIYLKDRKSKNKERKGERESSTYWFIPKMHATCKNKIGWHLDMEPNVGHPICGRDSIVCYHPLPHKVFVNRNLRLRVELELESRQFVDVPRSILTSRWTSTPNCNIICGLFQIIKNNRNSHWHY